MKKLPMYFLQYLFSKCFAKNLLFAILIFIVGIIGLNFWMYSATNHDQKIQVPNLSNKPIEEVQNILKELKLRYRVIDSSDYNPSYNKKSVVDQAPKAGTFVKEKRKIYLTLNPTDYEDIPIPYFYGKTRKEVEIQLRILGFQIGQYIYIHDLGKDVVRRLEHKGTALRHGKKLKKHSEIDMVLGNGKAN